MRIKNITVVTLLLLIAIAVQSFAGRADVEKSSPLEERNAILLNENLTAKDKVVALVHHLDKRISETPLSIPKGSETRLGYEYATIIQFIANPNINADSKSNPAVIQEVLNNLDEMLEVKNKALVRNYLYVALAYAGGDAPDEILLKFLRNPESPPEILQVVLKAMQRSRVPILAVPLLLEQRDNSFYVIDEGGDIGSYNPKRIYPVREAACETLMMLGIKCETTMVDVEQYEPLLRRLAKLPTTHIEIDRQSLQKKLHDWALNDDPQRWRPAIQVIKAIPDEEIEKMVSNLLKEKNLSNVKRQALQR